MKKNSLTLKIFIMLVLNDLLDTIAQIFMKKGLIQTDMGPATLANIMEFAAKNVSSPMIWLGVFVCVMNFFIWITILYRVDLSIAMPVGSTCYIFIPLAAMFFLHEHISILRWVGILLIILGIHFVSQSAKTASQGSVSA